MRARILALTRAGGRVSRGCAADSAGPTRRRDPRRWRRWRRRRLFARPAPTTRAGGASSRIRCSRRSRTAALDGQPRRRARRGALSTRRAPSSTTSSAIAIRRSLAGAAVDLREQAVPGFSDEPLRTTTYRAGLRRVLGARSVRPRALGHARRRGDRRGPRGGAGRRARQRGRRGGRATTSSCAACSSSWRCAERSLVNQRETLRLTEVRRDAGSARSRTWPAPRRASRRSKRHPAARARASPSREHRLAVLTGGAPGAADRRPRAAPLSGARPRRCRSAIRRCCCAAGRTCAPPSGGWRRPPRAKASPRPSSIRASRCRACLRPARRPRQRVRHADSRAWAVTPALQWARLRSRQRAGAAARRRGR